MRYLMALVLFTGCAMAPPSGPASDAEAAGPASAPATSALSEADAAAEAAARAWLQQIDEGAYAESWDAAAPYFQRAVSREVWAQQVGAVRGPLGALVQRELSNRQATSSLPGAPDGEYVVLTYDASFDKKKTATETVTVMETEDGTWAGVGYFIR